MPSRSFRRCSPRRPQRGQGAAVASDRRTVQRVSLAPRCQKGTSSRRGGVQTRRIAAMLSASSSTRAQFMEPFGLAHLLMTGSASSPSRRSRTSPRTVTPPPSPRPLRQTRRASEPALRPAKVNRAGRKDEDRQVREVLSNVSDRSYALFQAASARFIHELAAMSGRPDLPEARNGRRLGLNRLQSGGFG